MSQPAANPFPNYLEMPAKVPPVVWHVLRGATFAVMAGVTALVVVQPEIGFTIFWRILIPSLPFVFAVAPGVWRQICPMAMLNQIPRTFGFSLNRTLPVYFKNLAYFIAVLSFFFLVSLRHVYFNTEPAMLLALIGTALALAFIGGTIFKGRSGWCGTFCPLGPIQKAYGHAPIAVVRNGYCPTCVGCQKNCYDFNPRAAFFSDLSDSDPWYASHKKFFVAGLPGFAFGFFTTDSPVEIGLLNYYVYLTACILMALGAYMALRIFVRMSDFRIASLFALLALTIFYWFSAPTIVKAVAGLAGVSSTPWAEYALFALVIGIVAWVYRNGLRAENAFIAITKGTSEPKVGVKSGSVIAASGSSADLITERASGRSFPASSARTLLDGIESAGLKIDFGCRMGVCGADPIAIIEGQENLSPADDNELKTLRRLGLEGRARLACVCKAPKGNVTIDLKTDPRTLPEPETSAPQIDQALAMNIERIVIVGNGAAGIAAADEIRRRSQSCKIDLVTRENHQFYNRMGIARLLYGRSGIDELMLMQPQWYATKNVHVWLNTVASEIDRTNQIVRLGTGEELPYDRLILAMGASAVSPPVPGIDLPGCFALREAADATALRAWRQNKKCVSAVVLGGGVLGIETADALRQLNLKVTVVQRDERLMNRELDHTGSAILRRFIEGLGVQVVTGTTVAEIKGKDRLERVVLTNGDILDADIYVACAGVRPNIEIARDAGLEVKRGVLVDSSMRTSDPNIWAIGDVAELPGAISGLWAVGTAQAGVAVAAIFGDTSPYAAPNTLVSLKMSGIDVKGYGTISGDLGTSELIEFDDEPAQTHRKLVIDNGHIRGAVFVGPPKTGQHIAAAIASNKDLTPILPRLRLADWDALAEI